MKWMSNLKEAREKAGYSIEQVSLILNIRRKYLIAIEEDDIDSMPGMVYVAGYKKIYCDFLGIKQETLNIVEKIKLSDVSNKTNKYKKYTILCSFCLLVFVILAYNYLAGNNNYI